MLFRSKASLDFSFAGLKTAMLYAVRGRPVGRGRESRFERDHTTLSPAEVEAYAHAFEAAVVEVLCKKIERAAAAMRPRPATLVVGGGVSANGRLRRELPALAERLGLTLRVPPLSVCLDNAAMIAGLGLLMLERGVGVGGAERLRLSALPTGAG